jgi:hypothetical protein
MEASLEIMFKLNCRTFKVFLNIFMREYKSWNYILCQ